MNGPIRWFASNPVAANLMMVVMLVAGLFSIPIIQQQMFPELETHMIVVSVPYLGASPSEVEEGVCVRIEEELNGLSGIEKITSSSAEGACAVTVELLSDQPIDRSLSEIKNSVDSITTFPEETERPIVGHLEIQHNVLQVVLSGQAEERTLRYWGERLRDGMLALPGFTHVDLTNVRDFEISIEVSESSLRRYGLTFEEVANAVRRSSLDLPGGVPDVSVLFPKRAGAAASLNALWESHALPHQGEAIVCAADGFASEPVPLAALREGVLIHTLEGEPLPLGKGGPFRLMIPPDTPGVPSSCANVKSVVRIVMRETADG